MFALGAIKSLIILKQISEYCQKSRPWSFFLLTTPPIMTKFPTMVDFYK